MIRAISLLTTLALSGPAAAQTQTEINRQAAARTMVADVTMTQQWRAVYAQMKRLDAQEPSGVGGSGYAAAALESQRAWLPFRDRQCFIEAGEYYGGSISPTVRAQCLTRLTHERTVQLKNLIWTNR